MKDVAPLTPQQERAKALFNESLNQQHRTTDTMFGYLMVAQYFGATVWAFVANSSTWDGHLSSISPTFWNAMMLGGLIAGPVAARTYYKPGEVATRWTVSLCQLLMSALIISISGGRIEAHFHIFLSLACLAYYRDWKVLIPATAVTMVDHAVRGVVCPESIYGIYQGAEWKFLEHGSWILFEVLILFALCSRGVREMRMIADRQAELEITNEEIESLVQVRTQELQRSEERKSAILDNALDAIISTDAAGRITEFNPAAEAMFQRTKEDVLGGNLSELIISRNANGNDHMLNERVEITARRADGEVFPVEISVTPVRFGNEVMFTGFIRDIGEQRRLETELAHAQKLESIGRLAAGVAHEINTPNQYIGDNIRFLEESFGSLEEAIKSLRELHEDVRADGTKPELVRKVDEVVANTDLEFVLEEVPRAVTQSLEGVERVASIVKAMKDFSHPGQEVQTSVSLNKVIESTVTVARNEWKYVADVELSLDPNLPSILGHPGALGQVLLNLIINSVHAIKERYGEKNDGRIRIATGFDDDWVTITLSDNGCGIPEEAQPRIFEPFFTTKDVGLGTGQGLAISHGVICEAHRGQIEFTTARNEGTTFTLRLPVESFEELAA